MDIKVISLNVNSIVSYGRRYLLNEFITRNPAHVYMIQETKFGKSHKYSFPQYSSFLATRAIGTGGALLLTHSSLKIRNFRTIGGLLDGVFVDALVGNEWITFGSIYVGPTCPNIDALAGLAAKCRHFVFGGDYNARDPAFGDMSANTLGRHLLNWSANIGCAILNPSSPTCFHAVEGTHIDKFVVNSDMPFSFSSIENVSSFSDHSGIVLVIHCPAVNLTIRNGFMLKQYEKINTTRMNAYLERRLGELEIPANTNLLPGDLEEIALRINDILLGAANTFVPTNFIRAGGVILSQQTRALAKRYHREQRKLHRQINIGAWRPDINHTRREIGLLRQMMLNAVGNDLGNHYRDRMADTTSMRNAHRNVKLCTGYRRRGACPDVLYVNDVKSEALIGYGAIANGFLSKFSENHELTRNNHSSADAVVKNYANKLTGAGLQIGFDQATTARISNNDELRAINDDLPLTQRNVLTSAEEVAAIIRGAPAKKSTGSDQMPYVVLKTFSPAVILLIVTFFNQLLACAHFPTIWKHAQVTPIPKVGRDSSIITNWRPISNLNCLSKIFERILAGHIALHLDTLDLFPDQFGFLRGHSSVHALGKLQSAVNNGLNDGKFTAFVSLDLRAAFDTVWHDGLLFKMSNLGFPVFLIKTIQSFLANRSFSIRMGEFTSDTAGMSAGTPQGSVCSPILFNIFLYDLPRDQSNFVHNIQFADDTSSYCTSDNAGNAQCALNIHLARLSDFFRKWKLLLNERKTLLMIFLGFARDSSKGLRRRFQRIIIQVNGHVLPVEMRIRFLGIIFDRNNRFVGHVDHALRRARRSYFALRPMLRSRIIETGIKTNMYKSYIRPILTYASAIWAREVSLSAHQMERLRSFERGILRMTSNIRRAIGSYRYTSNTDLHSLSGVQRIDRYMMEKSVEFYERCSTSASDKIRVLVDRGANGLFTSLSDYWRRNNDGNLYANGKLLIFHDAYDRSGRRVYNENQ